MVSVSVAMGLLPEQLCDLPPEMLEAMWAESRRQDAEARLALLTVSAAAKAASEGREGALAYRQLVRMLSNQMKP